MLNHRKLILHVSIGMYGSMSDKTIILFDEAMIKVKSKFYRQYNVQIYNANGVLEEFLFDVHTINDNGYTHCAYMMEPSKSSNNNAEKAWSKMLESLRKVHYTDSFYNYYYYHLQDVECVFGMMKQQFAVLKYGYRGNKGPVLDLISANFVFRTLHLA